MRKKSTNNRTSIRMKRGLTSKFWRVPLFIVRKLGLTEFFLRVARTLSERQPYFLDIYGKDRFVEYAWVLRNLKPEYKRILDVGCWGTLFPIMLASLGYEVVGIDIKDYPFEHRNFRFIKGDILDERIQKSLRGEGKFDVITLISTLEHIGIEPYTEDFIRSDADILTLTNLKICLHPEGIFLITIPYGKPKILKRPVDHKYDSVSSTIRTVCWCKVYNDDEVRKLSKEAGLIIENIEYFAKKGNHWLPVKREEVQELDYPELDSGGIKGIACLKLRKVEESK